MPKRYSKDNYVLDPINIYFYISSLTDVEKKKNGSNKNIVDLLNSINNSVNSSPDLTEDMKKKHLGISLKDIYQEIQKPTK